MKPRVGPARLGSLFNRIAPAIVVLGLAGPARAADPVPPDPCKVAVEVLGKKAVKKTMKAADCQGLLDAAEEERWQLWLDIAAADELSGDSERAALALNSFVEGADARGTNLPAHWVVMRDDARTTIARLDKDLMEKRGRVTLTTEPPGAEVSFVGNAGSKVPEKTPKTPVTAYFEPGTHAVRLLHRASNAAREVSFTVTAGKAVELKVDLRPNAPAELAVQETAGPAILGQKPGTETAPAEVVATPVETRPDEDKEGPPIKRPGPSTWVRVGSVAVALGGAALAVGTVFVVQGVGLDDEAACSGAACDVDVALRAQVRREASVAWDRATGALIAGAVLVGGGIAAILLLDDPEESTSFVPWIGPSGGGVTGQLRF
ncbi:MAG: PEGA domain-containing protein [Deltaproteobacteria bacterium]|nr:PEGA domain-containing protein [Deltaproteobacteria bacterium]